MDPLHVTWPLLLGGAGGLLGSLRAAAYAKEDGSRVKAAINVCIGVVSAAAIASGFVADESPWNAVPIGIVTGSAGGYVLDAMNAMAPGVFRDWLRKFLGLAPNNDGDDPHGG